MTIGAEQKVAQNWLAMSAWLDGRGKELRARTGWLDAERALSDITKFAVELIRFM